MKPRFYTRPLATLAPIALVFNQAEFDAILKSIEVPLGSVWLSDAAGAAVTVCDSSNGTRCYVVSVRTDDDGITVATRLVHEATHIKQQEMMRLGEKSPSVEFEAYMLDSIFEGLAREYTRKLGLA